MFFLGKPYVYYGFIPLLLVLYAAYGRWIHRDVIKIEYRKTEYYSLPVEYLLHEDTIEYGNQLRRTELRWVELMVYYLDENILSILGKNNTQIFLTVSALKASGMYDEITKKVTNVARAINTIEGLQRYIEIKKEYDAFAFINSLEK